MSDTAAALTSCWVGFAVWSTAVMTLPGSRLCAVTAFSGHPKKLGNWGFWRRNLPRTRCRWATHGGPTDANAHPHLGDQGRLALIHNGIIENFAELRAELVAAGDTFT